MLEEPIRTELDIATELVTDIGPDVDRELVTLTVSDPRFKVVPPMKVLVAEELPVTLKAVTEELERIVVTVDII